MGHDMICWSRFLPQSISSLLHLLFSLVDRAQDSCISPTSFIIQVVYEKGGLHLLFYLEYYSLIRKKYALYWQLFEFAWFPCKKSLVQTLPNLCYGPKKLKNSTWKTIPFLNLILFSEQSLHKSWADWIQKKSYIYYYTLIRSL